MSCERFHDQLGEFAAGRLDRKPTRALLEHAASCEQCGAVLAMEEALALHREEGTDARVPDHLVDDMWERLRPELTSVPARRRPRPASFLGRYVVRGAVAALLAALLLAAGFLLGRRGPVRETERDPRPEASPSSQLRVASATPTAESLLEELASLPASTTVVSEAEARAFLRRSAPARRWLAESGIELDPDDGVQAGELRQVLEKLPPGEPIPLPPSPGTEALRRWLQRRV